VLSQLINQTYQFNLDEKKVDFFKVKNKLSSNYSGETIDQIFNKISNSRAFNNLNKYRNCSVHRRQIFIWEEFRSVRHTNGYNISSTEPGTETIRIICDNPYDLNPKIIQKREIPQYLIKQRKYILKEINEIIKLLP